MKENFLMNAFPKITLSIPAYNDEKSLSELLTDIEVVLEKLELTPNFYIIDDGSSDNTFGAAKRFQEKNSDKYFIELVQNPTNKGFGYTLKKVFTAPKTDWILFLPGDNQFPAESISVLLKYIEQSSFIIGYRKKRKDGLNRKIISYIYNLFIRFASGVCIHDVNSIVLFRKSLLNGVTLKSDSAFIHAELFLKCASKQGFSEVEILHQSRKYGKSGGVKIQVLVSTFVDYVKYLLFLSL